MLRGSFVLSNNKAGTTAAYGSGFYATYRSTLAQSYQGKGGMILKFGIKNDPNPRILDLNDQKHKDFYNTLNPIDGSDLHEILRYQYHIVIIINEHILILNETVIEKEALNQLVQNLRTIIPRNLIFPR